VLKKNLGRGGKGGGPGEEISKKGDEKITDEGASAFQFKEH